MARQLSAKDAAALLEPRDTFALPLGPGQPPALLAALGERDDWEELRIGTALLAALDLAARVGVTSVQTEVDASELRVYRALRDSGANISFAPADFRRFEPILQAQHPRVMATAASPPDSDGWCSLSLHAGSTYRELQEVGKDAALRRGERDALLLPKQRAALRVELERAEAVDGQSV